MRRAHFRCDMSGPRVVLTPVWEHTIGSGHATLALRADWQEQLRRCHTELGIRRVRFHGLLSDDVGTLVRHGGRPLYSFFNADQIWDYLLATGMQPFVELSFTPVALASGKKTVFKYAGNVTPPRKMAQWTELIRRLARHAVERYGADEVREWNFEVWNEPNLKAFWAGTQKQYFDLYAATAGALKDVDGMLRVGGPATAENGWLEPFLEFTGRRKLPLDFVTTHYYPTDPTQDVSGETEEQLAAGRRGVLSERASAARAIVGDLPLYYTEWNTSSNQRDPLHDEPYAAAFVTKTLLDVSGIVDAYSFWTFSDIFEELYLPSLPFHGGFGLLTLHGVAKPTYRAFELLHQMGRELIVPVDGLHPTVNCWVAAGRPRTHVLLTNHALPRHEIETVAVRLRLDSMHPPRRATVTRIDDDHANPKRAWLEMGAPEHLSEPALKLLHDASGLTAERLDVAVEDDAVTCELTVPPHGTAMVVIE
ncbi:cellulase family glycosylhydrolase [soil metagenome]